jgi:hypothetical protein
MDQYPLLYIGEVLNQGVVNSSLIAELVNTLHTFVCRIPVTHDGLTILRSLAASPSPRLPFGSSKLPSGLAYLIITD